MLKAMTGMTTVTATGNLTQEDSSLWAITSARLTSAIQNAVMTGISLLISYQLFHNKPFDPFMVYCQPLSIFLHTGTWKTKAVQVTMKDGREVVT